MSPSLFGEGLYYANESLYNELCVLKVMSDSQHPRLHIMHSTAHPITLHAKSLTRHLHLPGTHKPINTPSCVQYIVLHVVAFKWTSGVDLYVRPGIFFILTDVDASTTLLVFSSFHSLSFSHRVFQKIPFVFSFCRFVLCVFLFSRVLSSERLTAFSFVCFHGSHPR